MVLLIDAVINRQPDLAQRLGQQWIHRHGLAAFASLSSTRLQQLCGDDGLCWLQEQLGLQPAQRQHCQQPQQPGPEPSDHPVSTPQPLPLGSLLREALSEALQPLRQDGASAPSRQPMAAPAPVDAWRLPPLPSGDGASRTTAPPPADLAALRAWLHNDAA